MTIEKLQQAKVLEKKISELKELEKEVLKIDTAKPGELKIKIVGLADDIELGFNFKDDAIIEINKLIEKERRELEKQFTLL